MAVTGTGVRIPWRDRVVTAWRPARLAERSDLDPQTPAAIRATERARQLLLAADQRTPPHWEPLARLLLRAEGIASSSIEGVTAPVAAVVAAQEDPAAAGDAAAWVAANLAALDQALAHAAGDAPLTADELHSWHRTLMAGHTALPAHLIGAFRDELGWIGGPTPLDAALVTAPPADVPGLMADLLEHLNRTDGDPVADAAVGHAQFEIVHPYGDGNGRLGRLLILWTLSRRIGIRVLPPLSNRLAVDPGGYLSGMTIFRLTGADAWIVWFANALSDSAARVGAVVAGLGRLPAQWQERLDAAGVRRDAAARRLLAHLVEHPVLTARMAASYLGVSDRAARTAMQSLTAAGIVVPVDPRAGTAMAAARGRPQQWWLAREVSDLIAAG